MINTKSIKNVFSDFSLFKISKNLIAILSIAHLILANIHVSGLLKLENEICGFVMFVSIIMGLVCFFQSTRSKSNNVGELIPMIIFLLITVFSLIVLARIYMDAIRNQISLKNPVDVQKALALTLTMSIAYIVDFVLLVVDHLIRGKAFNGESKDDV